MKHNTSTENFVVKQVLENLLENMYSTGVHFGDFKPNYVETVQGHKGAVIHGFK